MSLEELGKTYPRVELKDISFDDYKASDGLNSSSLKHILKSPGHYKAALDQKFEQTPAQAFGSAVHAAILEPEEFEATYLTFSGDRRSKEYKELSAGLKEGQILLKQEEYDKVMYIRDAWHDKMIKDGRLQYLIGESSPEVSCYTKMQDNDVKGRFDLLGTEGFMDIKTTSDASYYAMRRSFYNFGYDFQLAFYGSMLGINSEIDYDSKSIYIAAIETSEPHGIAIYGISRDTYMSGEMKLHDAFEKYQNCKITNEWELYPQIKQF